MASTRVSRSDNGDVVPSQELWCPRPVACRWPRVSLPHYYIYHFNIIYNHAQCPLSCTKDTEMALDLTVCLVKQLEKAGYVNSYFFDRDHRSENSLSVELQRVLRGSWITILLLTPEFLDECLPVYLSITGFKDWMMSLDVRNRLVTVCVGISEEEVKHFLPVRKVIDFRERWTPGRALWEQLVSEVTLGMNLIHHRSGYRSPRAVLSNNTRETVLTRLPVNNAERCICDYCKIQHIESFHRNFRPLVESQLHRASRDLSLDDAHIYGTPHRQYCPHCKCARFYGQNRELHPELSYDSTHLQPCILSGPDSSYHEKELSNGYHIEYRTENAGINKHICRHCSLPQNQRNLQWKNAGKGGVDKNEKRWKHTNEKLDTDKYKEPETPRLSPKTDDKSMSDTQRILQITQDMMRSAYDSDEELNSLTGKRTTSHITLYNEEVDSESSAEEWQDYDDVEPDFSGRFPYLSEDRYDDLNGTRRKEHHHFDLSPFEETNGSEDYKESYITGLESFDDCVCQLCRGEELFSPRLRSTRRTLVTRTSEFFKLKQEEARAPYYKRELENTERNLHTHSYEDNEHFSIPELDTSAYVQDEQAYPRTNLPYVSVSHNFQREPEVYPSQHYEERLTEIDDREREVHSDKFSLESPKVQATSSLLKRTLRKTRSMISEEEAFTVKSPTYTSQPPPEDQTLNKETLSKETFQHSHSEVIPAVPVEIRVSEHVSDHQEEETSHRIEDVQNTPQEAEIQQEQVVTEDHDESASWYVMYGDSNKGQDYLSTVSMEMDSLKLSLTDVEPPKDVSEVMLPATPAENMNLLPDPVESNLCVQNTISSCYQAHLHLASHDCEEENNIVVGQLVEQMLHHLKRTEQVTEVMSPPEPITKTEVIETIQENKKNASPDLSETEVFYVGSVTSTFSEPEEKKMEQHTQGIATDEIRLSVKNSVDVVELTQIIDETREIESQTSIKKEDSIQDKHLLNHCSNEETKSSQEIVSTSENLEKEEKDESSIQRSNETVSQVNSSTSSLTDQTQQVQEQDTETYEETVETFDIPSDKSMHEETLTQNQSESAESSDSEMYSESVEHFAITTENKSISQSVSSGYSEATVQKDLSLDEKRIAAGKDGQASVQTEKTVMTTNTSESKEKVDDSENLSMAEEKIFFTKFSNGEELQRKEVLHIDEETTITASDKESMISDTEKHDIEKLEKYEGPGVYQVEYAEFESEMKIIEFIKFVHTETTLTTKKLYDINEQTNDPGQNKLLMDSMKQEERIATQHQTEARSETNLVRSLDEQTERTVTASQMTHIDSPREYSVYHVTQTDSDIARILFPDWESSWKYQPLVDYQFGDTGLDQASLLWMKVDDSKKTTDISGSEAQSWVTKMSQDERRVSVPADLWEDVLALKCPVEDMSLVSLGQDLVAVPEDKPLTKTETSVKMLKETKFQKNLDNSETFAKNIGKEDEVVCGKQGTNKSPESEDKINVILPELVSQTTVFDQPFHPDSVTSTSFSSKDKFCQESMVSVVTTSSTPTVTLTTQSSGHATLPSQNSLMSTTTTACLSMLVMSTSTSQSALSLSSPSDLCKELSAPSESPIDDPRLGSQLPFESSYTKLMSDLRPGKLDGVLTTSNTNSLKNELSDDSCTSASKPEIKDDLEQESKVTEHYQTFTATFEQVNLKTEMGQFSTETETSQSCFGVTTSTSTTTATTTTTTTSTAAVTSTVASTTTVQSTQGSISSVGSWLLPIYEGVCHAIAKPDMPYMG